MPCNCRHRAEDFGAVAPGGLPATYTVQRGDTLTGIAYKLGLCGNPRTRANVAGCLAVAEAFQRLNPQIQDINVIQPGWVLTVPGGPGDTVSLAPLVPAGSSPSKWLAWLGLGAVGFVLWKASR